jgi:hypothetical protein
MRLSSQIAFVVALVTVAIEVRGQAMPSRTQSTQSTTTTCESASACATGWTSTLVIYVTDARGAAIAGAQVTVQPAPISTSITGRVVTTDEYGMAAVSLPPHHHAGIRIASTGFMTATMDDIAAEPGQLQVINVRLAIDSKALRGLF